MIARYPRRSRRPTELEFLLFAGLVRLVGRLNWGPGSRIRIWRELLRPAMTDRVGPSRESWILGEFIGAKPRRRPTMVG